MITTPRFTLPAALRADRPAELRGLKRDQVRLLVIDRAQRRIMHSRFDRLGRFLRPGDLLVVNSSRTIPAAVPARRVNGEWIQLRPCVRRPAAWDALAVEAAPPHRNVPLHWNEVVVLGGQVRAIVVGRRMDIPFLWRLRVALDDLDAILRYGEPIRYSYVPAPLTPDVYQTVFASHPGSAEIPSAGRAFTWELVFALRRRGIETVDIVLHTGLSSFQDDEFDAEHKLFEEWFSVSPQVAAAVGRARRVIAVGTSVVRALETAAAGPRRVAATSGWTNLQIAPGSPLQVADALLTGLHEPQASHFDLLRTFVEEDLLMRAYGEAVDLGYLWHEFGDLSLIV